jgi:predicted nucleotidyltransferase component of viral defense system
MNLEELRDAYLADGFSYLDAGSRACQDIILSLIAKSALVGNVTIKGGVVMQHLSGDSRRATQDFDFDFIRYSLSEQSIRAFINKLNEHSEGISINVVSAIEELKHQDYKGKRVYVRITDGGGTYIDTKLDIGVHKDISMEQDLYCFDLCKLDDSVSLLINTKEQIFAEKLNGLLRLGNLSTRYKDIYDLYWLAMVGEMNNAVLLADIKSIIFNDPNMRENNVKDIASRLSRTFADSHFMISLRQSKRHNWLDIDPAQATETIVGFIKGL